MLVNRAILIVLACSSLMSCVAMVAASAAGVGFVKYQKNEAARVFDQDLKDTWLAALEAMAQLGYGAPLEKKLLVLEGSAEYEDGAEKIRLRVEAQVEGGTRLIVRVGKFDNKTHRRKALVILEETSGILGCDDELRAWSEKVRELGEPDPGSPEAAAD